jgi:hypothetical protein
MKFDPHDVWKYNRLVSGKLMSAEGDNLWILNVKIDAPVSGNSFDRFYDSSIKEKKRKFQEFSIRGKVFDDKNFMWNFRNFPCINISTSLRLIFINFIYSKNLFKLKPPVDPPNLIPTSFSIKFIHRQN